MNKWFTLNCWLRRWYRHGLRFQEYTRQLMESDQYSPIQIAQYQQKKLQHIIHHCYRHVPYYQDLFRELKLKPEQIQKPEDLKKLPILDKSIVQQNFDRFISKKHKNWLCNTGSTSGTTGMPGKFVRDFNAINFEQAVVWRHWKKAGDYGKRRVSLRGDTIIPSSQNYPPFWKFNPATQELIMSSYHLSHASSIYYIQEILSFQPKILYCGPSMGYMLARFFQLNQVSYEFEAIFTSSESLEAEVRQTMESAFNCRVYDWYGQAERVAAIGQCPNGVYHVQEDYSIVEFLPTQDDDIFEIIGSQLMNEVMPLLRYRTQDFVHTSSKICKEICACGSTFRKVDHIFGRTYGYLLTPEGYHIAITAHIPVGVDNVIEAQFHQEKQGEVILKVLTNGCFTENDRERLISNTLKHTSPKMKVIVQEVTDIPRGPNGKFINIVNHMSSEQVVT